MIIGPSSKPPVNANRVPIKIHPKVRENLGILLWQPELHAVGYSEFIQRAIDHAYKEIEAFRAMAEAHELVEKETGDIDGEH